MQNQTELKDMVDRNIRVSTLQVVFSIAKYRKDRSTAKVICEDHFRLNHTKPFLPSWWGRVQLIIVVTE
jgi:hypothetical protein